MESRDSGEEMAKFWKKLGVMVRTVDSPNIQSESEVRKTSYGAVREILGRCTSAARKQICADFNVAWRRYALYRGLFSSIYTHKLWTEVEQYELRGTCLTLIHSFRTRAQQLLRWATVCRH